MTTISTPNYHPDLALDFGTAETLKPQLVDLGLAVETPYNKPFFHQLDLSQVGKIREGATRPIAFVIGLEPVLRSDGTTTHLALSGMTEILEMNTWQDLVETLCNKDGRFFSYVTYDSHNLDSFLKFLPVAVLLELVADLHSHYNGTQIWYTPGHKLTLLHPSFGEARIQVVGTWSKRLSMQDAFARAGNFLSKEELESPIAVAHAVRDLGRAIKTRTQEFLGKAWGDVSSPSALTKQILAKDLRTVDTASIPMEAMRLAYESLHAPWIEMLAQGYFPKTYDYDIDSAYPNEIAKLIICDSRVGTWVNSSRYESQAEYGFALGIIISERAPGDLSPIRFRKNTGKLFSPYGTWIGYITKDEIDFLRKYRLGRVEILEGWWFVPNTRVHPFLATVEHLLKMRAKARSSDPVLAAMMKSVAARMNGHFLQKHEKFNHSLSTSLGGPGHIPNDRDPEQGWLVGGMFNPIYACTVMTRTKLRLAEIGMEVVKKEGKILAVTVDGLLSTVPLKRETGRKLAISSPAIIAAPLVIHLEDKPGRVNILKALWRNPSSTHYQIGETRRIPLTEALKADRKDLIASEQPGTVTIAVGSDVTRIWRRLPLRGKDLLSRAFYSTQPAIEYATLTGGNGIKTLQEHKKTTAADLAEVVVATRQTKSKKKKQAKKNVKSS